MREASACLLSLAGQAILAYRDPSAAALSVNGRILWRSPWPFRSTLEAVLSQDSYFLWCWGSACVFRQEGGMKCVKDS